MILSARQLKTQTERDQASTEIVGSWYLGTEEAIISAYRLSGKSILLHPWRTWTSYIASYPMCSWRRGSNASALWNVVQVPVEVNLVSSSQLVLCVHAFFPKGPPCVLSFPQFFLDIYPFIARIMVFVVMRLRCIMMHDRLSKTWSPHHWTRNPLAAREFRSFWLCRAWYLMDYLY